MEPILNLAIDSDASRVADVQAGLLDACGQAGLDSMAAFQLTSAAIETINNCIEHAYRDEPGHPVHIVLHADSDAVEVEIRDQGTPLPDGVPASDAVPDPDALSGRGWPIIHLWTDAVSYRRDGNNNILTLSKRRETPQS